MTTFVINWMAMQLFTLDRKTPEVLDVDIHSWGIILRSKSIFWILVTMHLIWDYNSLHNYIWIDHRLKFVSFVLMMVQVHCDICLPCEFVIISYCLQNSSLFVGSRADRLVLLGILFIIISTFFLHLHYEING